MKWFFKLKSSLEEKNAKGHDNYPTTLPHALNLLHIHESTLPRNYGQNMQVDKKMEYHLSKQTKRESRLDFSLSGNTTMKNE